MTAREVTVVLLTDAQEMSFLCVPLAPPVSADVSPNRDRPLSTPDYTGKASGTLVHVRHYFRIDQ